MHIVGQTMTQWQDEQERRNHVLVHSNPPRQSPERWEKACMGWHKLNVDVAGDINRGLFGSSSVIQNSQGVFVAARGAPISLTLP